MIDNKYQLVKRLGKGGSSDVFLAKDELDCEFAIKIIRKEKDKPMNGCVSELQKEQLIMEMVKAHPNILNCAEFVCEGDIVMNGKLAKINYNVLEYSSNGTLAVLSRKHSGMEEHLVRFYLQQLASAVYYLHECGLAHCDIKPQNILLDANYNAKLADFGTCEVDSQSDSLCRQRKGTPKYMAPEVDDFNRTDPYNMYMADVYSLGVTTFYMLTGKTPDKMTAYSDQASTNSLEEMESKQSSLSSDFKGTFLNLGISGELMELLESMLNEDPTKRPTTGDVLSHPWFSLGYLDVTPEEVFMAHNGAY